MINANELRIGNWIKTPNGKPMCVKNILENSVNQKIDGDGVVGSYQLANFEPIPLSPDILLSTGFKYLKVEGVSSFEEFHNPDEDTHCWSFNVKSTDLIDSHEICLVKWGEEEYFTFQLGRGTYRKKIKYLHELQNGMFFLTGEELTINLLKT